MSVLGSGAFPPSQILHYLNGMVSIKPEESEAIFVSSEEIETAKKAVIVQNTQRSTV